jgi:murein DD-endopeptidase MepM/ murein hydrolase activator NlpD
MSGIFIVIVLICAPALAGFLEPTSFPTVVSDMSFIDRMALLASGYEQFESEYDADGNCISGCSYAAPKLEDEIAAMERWNALVKHELVEEYNYTENTDGSLTPPPTNNLAQSQASASSQSGASTPFPSQNNVPANVINNENCAVRAASFGDKTIPYGSPLGHISCISSPYGITRTIRGNTHVHYGIDLRAKTGTPVYSPASGTVTVLMIGNPSCGNGMVIKHANGYSTKYCHFSVVSVKRGQQVSAGCMIGRVGNTGFSTGPHLHYSVYKDGGTTSKHSVDPKNFIEPANQCCPGKC